MKHLIIFSYDFPPSNGGIARLCQEIAVGMQVYYNKITVVTRKTNGQNIPYNSSNIEVVEFSPKRMKIEWEAFRYLKKLANKQDIDVLCGVWHPEATISYLAGMKNIYILGHGTEFLSGKSNFRKNFWLPFYASWILKKVKMVIANSSYTKRMIYNIDSSIPVVALPLAVNQNFFKPVDNKKYSEQLQICSLSRIFQFKGYDFIAKSIAGLPLEYQKQIYWSIGGTGPYLEELKVLVNNLEIANSVCFLGFIKDQELPDFYGQNDLFILCTREEPDTTSVEGFGLVFLEAQSCGVPVIGTNTGGIPDAVSIGNGGWLIEQDNETELRELLIELIENPSLLKEMTTKARSRVINDCTWDKYCAKLFEVMAN